MEYVMIVIVVALLIGSLAWVAYSYGKAFANFERAEDDLEDAELALYHKQTAKQNIDAASGGANRDWMRENANG